MTSPPWTSGSSTGKNKEAQYTLGTLSGCLGLRPSQLLTEHSSVRVKK